MNDYVNSEEVSEETIMSIVEFARLGDGEIAYIKELDLAQAQRLFPSVDDLPSGIDLYSLHSADGTPIALTDTRDAAIANAIENDLEMVSLH